MINKIWASAWDFQQCGMCDQQSLRSSCAYAQSDQILCKSLEFSINVKLLTEHHLQFLRLKGGCTGSSESVLVKMPHCWKSHVGTQFARIYFLLAPWKEQGFAMFKASDLDMLHLPIEPQYPFAYWVIFQAPVVICSLFKKKLSIKT